MDQLKEAVTQVQDALSHVMRLLDSAPPTEADWAELGHAVVGALLDSYDIQTVMLSPKPYDTWKPSARWLWQASRKIRPWCSGV